MSSFGSFGGTYTAMPGYSSSAAETKVAAYCYENTMLKEKQKNGYTTGIVFKAEIAPSKMMQKKTGSGGVEENSTFTSMSEIFYHSGIFYKDIAALKEAGVLLADGTTSSSASGASADLKKNDVQCFKKGVPMASSFVIIRIDQAHPFGKYGRRRDGVRHCPQQCL